MNGKRFVIPLAAAVLTMGSVIGTADAAEAPAKAPEPRLAASCPYTAICVWSGPNYTGTKKTYWSCDNHAVDFFGPISYLNNQTPGTVAMFKTQNGWNVATPGARSHDASVGSSKTYFYYVDPCD
ncbi:hypothetical protein E1293_19655 [Actinomadura darangshiensis]|uniref:Peptidase inhibitor family I36 protein n=1 Tax=Actinomadura darangshiensis TaxID=705336 RepID=A0A4R5BB38_9ACTN|nr:peptidase inhibitor family I36 protein [Actinomadura darangshiensis]TDD80964.1 hypothetical protein E1293_19655 [Actinomadura darangshiensis]